MARARGRHGLCAAARPAMAGVEEVEGGRIKTVGNDRRKAPPLSLSHFFIEIENDTYYRK